VIDSSGEARFWVRQPVAARHGPPHDQGRRNAPSGSPSRGAPSSVSTVSRCPGIDAAARSTRLP